VLNQLLEVIEETVRKNQVIAELLPEDYEDEYSKIKFTMDQA
jgi:hypothetical protein